MSDQDYSFPPSHRVTKASEYRHFFHGAKKIHKDQFMLIAKPNKLGLPRLGLIIAKKYIKKANKRNTVKRVIRESFRYHQSLLQGLDVVIVARKGLGQLSKAEFRQELDGQWQRLVKLFKRR